MSYHGIVKDMLPTGTSVTARASRQTNVSNLPVAARPSAESSFQAQPEAVAAPNKNAYQSVMPGGESLAPSEPGYNDVPETSSRGDTKDRSMNYTMLNAAAKATQPSYQPTYVPVATNISLSRLASAAASGATKKVAASSLPALVNARSAAFSPAMAPVVVDSAPPEAPPVVVVEEEPWYKSPAVMGIGILLLVAGGYALYKSQGT